MYKNLIPVLLSGFLRVAGVVPASTWAADVEEKKVTSNATMSVITLEAG